MRRFEFSLPDSDNSIMLLDTPGYSEADVTSQQQTELAKAAEMADIILLVMAANVSARDADVQVVRRFAQALRARRNDFGRRRLSPF